MIGGMIWETEFNPPMTTPRPLSKALALLILLAAPLATHARDREPQTIVDDALVAAGKVAKESMADQGFRVRADHWAGVIEPGKARWIRTQCFKGNEYWFWFAADKRLLGKSAVAIRLYDNKGRELKIARTVEKGNVIGALYQPESSGMITVWLKIEPAANAADPVICALLTAYK